MPTPHNAASPGDIAPTVFMPGDPLRARFIAERYLKDVRQFNSVRGMLGFTGTFGGKPVSVMGSGMGMPSIGIYSHELFSEYGVENIIRLGSCGGYREDLKVFDVFLVTDAYSESSYARCAGGFTGDVIAADAGLTDALRQSAKRQGIEMIEGRTHSSDVFYYAPSEGEPLWRKLMREKDCAVVEMESFALFYNAVLLGKKAACVLTVSDTFVSQQITTAEERERSFTRMAEVALGIL